MKKYFVTKNKDKYQYYIILEPKIRKLKVKQRNNMEIAYELLLDKKQK